MCFAKKNLLAIAAKSVALPTDRPFLYRTTAVSYDFGACQTSFTAIRVVRVCDSTHARLAAFGRRRRRPAMRLFSAMASVALGFFTPCRGWRAVSGRDDDKVIDALDAFATSACHIVPVRVACGNSCGSRHPSSRDSEDIAAKTLPPAEGVHPS